MNSYGKYVDRGTPGIFAPGGMALPFSAKELPYFSPRTPVKNGRQWMVFVRGQRPTGFILEGWTKASIRHSALRGNLLPR